MANWSGLSFARCDLRGFDFTGARLHGCKFEDSLIEGARFDQAEIGRIGLDASQFANLHQAKDWNAYAQNWTKPKRPASDRHLPVGAVFQDAPRAPRMTVVPAGQFWMGSPDGTGGDQGDEAEPGRYSDEGPRHLVTIDRPFAVSQFAITFAQWQECCQDLAISDAQLRPAHADPDQPVVKVSWRDITQVFLPWLVKMTGHPYRLLTEAEWEYSARAGTQTPYGFAFRTSDGSLAFGTDTISESNAHFDTGAVHENNPEMQKYRQRTRPVDHFPPNNWGLYNVHGNVFEWCQDPWHDDYRGHPPLDGTSWEADADHTMSIVRGGCFSSDIQSIRSAYRHARKRDDGYNDVGFRVARPLRF